MGIWMGITYLLTRALTTLAVNQNYETVGGTNMDTQQKQVQRITLGSVKTIDELTIRMEDLGNI
jgi:hypothetical protein